MYLFVFIYLHVYLNNFICFYQFLFLAAVIDFCRILTVAICLTETLSSITLVVVINMKGRSYTKADPTLYFL